MCLYVYITTYISCIYVQLKVTILLVISYWYIQLIFITLNIILTHSPCFSVTSLHNSKKAFYQLQLSLYYIVQFPYTYITAPELLASGPMGNHSIIKGTVFMGISLCLKP